MYECCYSVNEQKTFMSVHQGQHLQLCTSNSIHVFVLFYSICLFHKFVLHLSEYVAYVGTKLSIIMAIQQRIDNAVSISYEMNNHSSQLTEVLVSFLNEVDDEPMDLIGKHTDDEH